MGAFKEVSSFTLPLGVKINMDGIALVVNVGSIFDMKRMLVNITEDASCSIIVQNMKQKKDEKREIALGV